MTASEPSQSRLITRTVLILIFLSVAGGIVFAWPWITSRPGQAAPQSNASPPNGRAVNDGHDHASDGQGEDSHRHEDHDHAAHEDSNSLDLSSAAKKNLGLTAEYLRAIQLSTYHRTITVPAIVVARPGRSQIQVSAPLTGVVTHVHAVSGEAVIPGMLLFEIQLTHEELVTAQTDYLKTLGELDVETQEISRLEGVAESGAISGRNLIDRRYNRDKLTATLKALREALKLHGLSDRHVDEIEKDRRLLRSLQIMAPDIDRHDHLEELHLSRVPINPVSMTQDEDHSHASDAAEALSEHGRPSLPSSTARPLVIGELAVIKGQSVEAGDKLCVVSDYQTLFIEGQAFDQDAAAINALAENNWPITAIVPGEGFLAPMGGLKMAYISPEVDIHARTLSLFVELPNQLIRDVTNASEQRFVTWKYRPGQRMQLQVPVEQWNDQIVLPVDAVAVEGPEAFVFRQNGSHFDRVGVHVLHRDQVNVVVASDGSLFPGDVVAFRSAHQMQMAIKNKSGAGADPHAGHTH